jgi:hypothetical protein
MFHYESGVLTGIPYMYITQPHLDLSVCLHNSYYYIHYTYFATANDCA